MIIAAVIANITVHDLMGYAPVYDIPDFHIVSDWELGLYLVLGMLAVHMAPVFLNLLERSHILFARLTVLLEPCPKPIVSTSNSTSFSTGNSHE